MLRLFTVFILSLWLLLLLLAVGQTLGGWVHVLPGVVMLGLAARVAYARATLD